MAKTDTILLVPGLGKGEKSWFIRLVLVKWAQQGCKVVVFKSEWSSAETFEMKKDRLSELANRAISENGNVSVVGYSAGGALVMASGLVSSSRVVRISIVSGKLVSHHSIGAAFQRKAPALIQTVMNSEENIKRLSDEEKSKITTFSPIFDGLIPAHDMRIPAVRHRSVMAVGHPIGIAVALLFYA